MARKFTWDAWSYDCDGEAYIIAKSDVPNKEDVADYIIRVDHLDPACRSDMNIEQGFCKWQVRRDWEHDGDDMHRGGYVVEKSNSPTKKGWFPVWIIRKEEWY